MIFKKANTITKFNLLTFREEKNCYIYTNPYYPGDSAFDYIKTNDLGIILFRFAFFGLSRYEMRCRL